MKFTGGVETKLIGICGVLTRNDKFYLELTHRLATVKYQDNLADFNFSYKNTAKEISVELCDLLGIPLTSLDGFQDAFFF